MSTLLDQIPKWMTLAASVATVIAIYFLIRQIQAGIEQVKQAQSSLDVGIKQMSIAQSSLDEDRAERDEQRKLQRKTLWITLRTEVTSVLDGAMSNLGRFHPVMHGSPEEEQSFRDREIQGEPAYIRSFVWTPVPIETLERIMGEIHLLGLTLEEIQGFHDLRLKILKVNALALAKTAVLRSLVQGGLSPRQLSSEYHRWVEIEADQLNSNIWHEFNQIVNACNRISEWLSGTGEK